jgi:glucose/galactose transporter
MTNTRNNLIPIIIIGIFFFILGSLTWLNGILIPYLKTACELTNLQALFVTFAFYISYVVMALPSSMVLKKVGFKLGMSIALWVMALGTLIFIPAAMTRVYAFFLIGLFVMGTGMAILQTAINPYITILGPIESAARRISIMGIMNKAGGAIAPLVLAYFVVKAGDDEAIKNIVNLSVEEKETFLDALAMRVINPYIVIAIVLSIVGILIKFSPLPEIDTHEKEEKVEGKADDRASVFSYPYLVWGVLALFLYVGVEVIAGDTIIAYGKNIGIAAENAKMFTSYTMTAMLIGYVMGIILIPRYVSQHRALQASAIIGILFSIGVLVTNGYTSVFFIALLGLANALVWPAVWPLAIRDLGKHINTASALLIMAISGGAIMPLVWGQISDIYNSHIAYIILIPMYLTILWYSIKGYKMEHWRN